MTEDADFAGGGRYREEVLEGPRGAVDPVGVDRRDSEVARAPAELERLHPPAFVADENAGQFLVDLGLGHVPVAMARPPTFPTQMLGKCYIPDRIPEWRINV